MAVSTEIRPPTAAPAGVGAFEADPGRWKALWVVLIAAFMDILDATVVFLALPFVQRELGASDAQVQWTVAAYQLSFAALLITGGRLGDVFGRKRLYLLGVAGFTAASALCGLAPSAAVLIGARAIQGALAGLMVPQVLSIIQAGFPPRERGAAFGAFGAVLGLGNVGGPLVAGLILQADLFGLGWRPVFLMNLPLGLVALAGVWALQRESRAPRPPRLDLPGVALATTALLLVLYPLVQGRELGWPAWSWALMAAAVPVLGLFALHERRKARLDGSPLVPPDLFGRRAFVAGLLLALALFAGVTSFFLVYSLLAQVGLGMTPLQAGLVGLPWPLGIAVASGASVELAPRIGRRLLGLGALLMAAGMGALVLALRLGGAGVAGWQLLPGLALGGLGMGMVAPTLTDFVLAGVPQRDAGAASGVVNTAFQVGGAAGVAAVGTLFFALLADGTGFVAAAERVLWCQVGAFALAFLLVPLLPERPHAHE
jgi:EmrB/QacA subfamily drug resistance transporter